MVRVRIRIRVRVRVRQRRRQNMRPRGARTNFRGAPRYGERGSASL